MTGFTDSACPVRRDWICRASARYYARQPDAIDFATFVWRVVFIYSDPDGAIFAMIGNGGHFVTPRVAIGTTESQVESMMPLISRLMSICCQVRRARVCVP